MEKAVQLIEIDRFARSSLGSTGHFRRTSKDCLQLLAPTTITSIFCFTIGADFVRQAVDFYYPHAIHCADIADAGITDAEAVRPRTW